MDKSSRITSIDILRGIAMILMPLDHVRDFLSNSLYDPLDLTHTTPSLFFTRIIVNFCAPIFVFLSGTSMFIWKSSGKSIKEVSFFLFTRGLFLILCELTIIRTVWAFNFDLSFQLLQIFWTIGASMIFLSVTIYLPYWLIITVGTAILFAHDLFDKINPDSWGYFIGLFKILFGPGETQIKLFSNNIILQVEDPILPWIGVITLGYAFGKLYTFESIKRVKYLIGIASFSILIFIILRWINIYGDPQIWTQQDNLLFTILSFINTTKYPPSLDFLLFFLGIAIFLLALFEKAKGKFAEIIITFGRVPFAYYVTHVFLIHFIAVILSYITYGYANYLYSNHCLIGGITPEHPVGYGYNLPVIYFIWILVIFILYPFCRWYGKIKLKYTHIKFLRYI